MIQFSELNVGDKFTVGYDQFPWTKINSTQAEDEQTGTVNTVHDVSCEVTQFIEVTFKQLTQAAADYTKENDYNREHLHIKPKDDDGKC